MQVGLTLCICGLKREVGKVQFKIGSKNAPTDKNIVWSIFFVVIFRRYIMIFEVVNPKNPISNEEVSTESLSL